LRDFAGGCSTGKMPFASQSGQEFKVPEDHKYLSLIPII
jgi:hypothetical protein